MVCVWAPSLGPRLPYPGSSSAAFANIVVVDRLHRTSHHFQRSLAEILMTGKVVYRGREIALPSTFVLILVAKEGPEQIDHMLVCSACTTTAITGYRVHESVRLQHAGLTCHTCTTGARR